MSKLKLLKLPKVPRLPKKPAQTASLQTKRGWLNKAKDLKIKYEAKLRAVESENKKRRIINEESKKASTVISGIGSILEVRPGSFSVKLIRGPRKAASKGKVSGVKRKTTKRKAAPKRKVAAKRRR